MARAPRRSPPNGPESPERVGIDSIAAGGEGVGRLADGRAVFVHRTAPGDEVEVSLLTSGPRWARARLTRVVTPSPSRRDPPCPHYEQCGGCTLEHIRYEAQLDAKRRIVTDALHRIGDLGVTAPPVIPSPLEVRYRNRVSFTLRRTRAGRVHAGFHALHAPGRIVDIDGRCLLPEGPIAAVWDGLRAAWGPGAERLPPGDSLRLTLRGTAAGEVSLLIEGGTRAGQPADLLPRVEGLEAIWQIPDGGRIRHLAGATALPESWGGEAFSLSGAAFLQVNRHAAALLEAHVLDASGDVSGQRVIDAYCGVGVHSRKLAEAGASVIGIELDADAVATARMVAPTGVEVRAGRVEDLLPGALPADLVLLNPPRAGVADEAIGAILSRQPARLVYISCDPATLARDLRGLSPAYDITHVRCFDMFPQTAHVETVVSLVRRGPERLP